MKLNVRQRGEVIVVDLDGRLVAGTGAEVLHEVIDELLAGNWKRIVLDLSAVPRIDSAGVGELVGSNRLAQRFDATVKLVRIGGRVKEVLELSQIMPLMEVYEDEDEAVASFEKS